MVFTEPNLNVLAKPATVVVACGLSVTNSLARERRVRERKGKGREGREKSEGGREERKWKGERRGR